MPHPGCLFRTAKPKHSKVSETVQQETNSISSVSTVESFVKSSLLKPPRPVPQEIRQGLEAYLQEFSLPSTTTIVDGKLKSAAPPPMDESHFVEGSDDESDKILLGKCATMDPSLFHLKAAVKQQVFEILHLEKQLLKSSTILGPDLSVHDKEVMDKTDGQIDSVSFMVQWLSTEKRALDWHTSLLKEKSRNLDKEVKELESKCMHGFSEGDKAILEELWAEMLGLQKEFEQVQSRLATEKRCKRKMKKFLRSTSGSDSLPASKPPSARRIDPISFLRSPSIASTEFTESVSADSHAKSVDSKQDSVPAIARPPPVYTSVPNDARSTFDFFGSDFQAFRVEDAMKSIGRRQAAEQDLGKPLNCFNFQPMEVLKRWSSFNVAQSKSASCPSDNWVFRKSQPEDEEFSEEDSDFEVERLRYRRTKSAYSATDAEKQPNQTKRSDVLENFQKRSVGGSSRPLPIPKPLPPPPKATPSVPVLPEVDCRDGIGRGRSPNSTSAPLPQRSEFWRTFEEYGTYGTNESASNAVRGVWMVNNSLFDETVVRHGYSQSDSAVFVGKLDLLDEFERRLRFSQGLPGDREQRGSQPEVAKDLNFMKAGIGMKTLFSESRVGNDVEFGTHRVNWRDNEILPAL